MQAVVMHETGDPAVLRLEEAAQPEPEDGQVLVRVRAASVNPIDWKFRRGLVDKQLPAVLGSDLSGTVEVSRADGFAAGDEVFGSAASGSYAELATARGSAIAKKPAGLSHEQAAALGVAGLTAWQALFDSGALESGQTALIAGAPGGVGHFAVQFARAAGAVAIGTGSARNREFVLGLGAERFVDYTQEDVAAEVTGADVAFDTVGGQTTESLLASLREGGRLVTIAGKAPEEEAGRRGVHAERLQMSPDPGQLARIAELVAAGEVRVEMAEVFPLSEVARAHEVSEGGHVRGKLVLTVG